MNTRTVGKHFEREAEQHLCKEGLTLVTRNYRSTCGEIDLIMRDGEYWVFVEVKFRFDAGVEHPLGQLRVSQQQRIRRSAQLYLYSHGLNEYLTPCRFDLIAITADPAELIWIKNAF